jgi:hypothetical protein
VSTGETRLLEISNTEMRVAMHHHTRDMRERGGGGGGGEACDDDCTSTRADSRIPGTYETLRYEFVLKAHKPEGFA